MCGYDNGNCAGCEDSAEGECPGVYCAAGCHQSMLSDGVCNEACNVEACAFDATSAEAVSDCDFCAPGCHTSMLENEQCDEECNVEACGFDADMCSEETPAVAALERPAVSMCAPGCPIRKASNGRCDKPCNVEACRWVVAVVRFCVCMSV